jgi:hypothetical protein
MQAQLGAVKEGDGEAPAWPERSKVTGGRGHVEVPGRGGSQAAHPHRHTPSAGAAAGAAGAPPPPNSHKHTRNHAAMRAHSRTLLHMRACSPTHSRPHARSHSPTRRQQGQEESAATDLQEVLFAHGQHLPLNLLPAPAGAIVAAAAACRLPASRKAPP